MQSSLLLPLILTTMDMFAEHLTGIRGDKDSEDNGQKY